MKPSEANNRVRLRHMHDAAQEVMAFTAGKTRESLDQEMLLLRGVCMSIGIIGEAAAQITPAFRSANPKIDWQAIVGMRNLIIHAYFKVDKDILWNTINQHIPPLLAELDNLIQVGDEEP